MLSTVVKGHATTQLSIVTNCSKCPIICNDSKNQCGNLGGKEKFGMSLQDKIMSLSDLYPCFSEAHQVRSKRARVSL